MNRQKEQWLEDVLWSIIEKEGPQKVRELCVLMMKEDLGELTEVQPPVKYTSEDVLFVLETSNRMFHDDCGRWHPAKRSD